MNFDDFKAGARRTAIAQGFDGTNMVSWNIMGLSSGARPIERVIHVKNTPAPLYAGAVTELWFNPAEYKVYKSSNWYQPSAPVWQEVGAYNDMFIDQQDIASQLPPDIATESYVNEVLANLQGSGAVLPVLPPVQDIPALRLVDVSAVPDKQTIFVESEIQFYAYDFQSSAAEDAYTVRPASGVGRWVLTGPSKMDAGAF